MEKKKPKNPGEKKNLTIFTVFFSKRYFTSARVSVCFIILGHPKLARSFMYVFEKPLLGVNVPLFLNKSTKKRWWHL
jgi:hypothetical protein